MEKRILASSSVSFILQGSAKETRGASYMCIY